MAPQPGRGTQICQGDYQLCLCRVQSLTKAALTKAVLTSALILLLQTQGFSNPDFCSCARAHSKHPHPIPSGAKSTSLGLLCTYKLNQKQITPTLRSQRNTSPSCVRNVAHRRGHLQETALSSHGAAFPVQAGLLYTRQDSHFASLVCTGSRTKSFRGFCSHKTTSQTLEYQSPSTGPVLSQRSDAEVRRDRDVTLQQSRRYRWSGPLLLPEEKLGSFQTRTSPP